MRHTEHTLTIVRVIRRPIQAHVRTFNVRPTPENGERTSLTLHPPSGPSSSETNASSGRESNNTEIVCLFQKCYKLAAASFNTLSQTVKVLETCENYRPDYSHSRKLLVHLAPSIVIYNKNAPYDFSKHIQASVSGSECSLQGLPSNAFYYENCKETLLKSEFSCSSDNENYINSVINTGDERLVCALGVLIGHLKASRLVISPIISISAMSFDNLVWIDNTSFKCLQVFDPLPHSSGFKWSNQAQEGKCEELSVFSIIERHCSWLGSSQLRSFMSSPTKDCNELKRRHEVIRFFNHPKNVQIAKKMKKLIRHLFPVDILMRNVQCSYVRGKHWKRIYQNVYFSVLFAETCQENCEGVSIFQEIAECISDEMYSMAYHLDRIIDFNCMEGNESFVVKPGVSETLEAAKHNLSALMDALNKVVRYEFDSLPSYINKINLSYLPEIRFLLRVPYWKPILENEELELPGLEFKFSSNKTAYYKSPRCHELDDIFGDPKIEIMNEEANIIRALGTYITKNIHHTVKLMEKIAVVDCLFSLASLSKEFDYVEPNLPSVKTISILEGFHPLLKVTTNEFIPNNFVSSPEGSILKIIQGPTSSGKTVYMKQVALLIYLAHVGSFVPAREATIGLCSHIHVRIADSESILSESSSFINDLRKLVTVVKSFNERSLIVLDEIGGGTTELSGIALLASCLSYFASLGPGGSPHVMISTHLPIRDKYISSPQKMFSVEVMDYTIEDGKSVFLYSARRQEEAACGTLDVKPFSNVPDFISTSANKVLHALRIGEDASPYTNFRLKKYYQYCSFLRKFCNLNIKDESVVKKFREKLKFIIFKS